MRDTIRAHAEKHEGVTRVYLLEVDDCQESGWSVLDIAEGANIAEIMFVLDEKHDFSDKRIVVQDNEGEWVEPDAITVAEALECIVS
jgi:hypothetical protein